MSPPGSIYNVVSNARDGAKANTIWNASAYMLLLWALFILWVGFTAKGVHRHRLATTGSVWMSPSPLWTGTLFSAEVRHWRLGKLNRLCRDKFQVVIFPLSTCIQSEDCKQSLAFRSTWSSWVIYVRQWMLVPLSAWVRDTHCVATFPCTQPLMS